MEINLKEEPRAFNVGIKNQTTIFDCGSINLDPDEQVTFITDNGNEYDVARKYWGFYATPSINGRLKTFGFKTALTQNSFGKNYIMLVEKTKITEFYRYLREDKLKLVEWLDER